MNALSLLILQLFLITTKDISLFFWWCRNNTSLLECWGGENVFESERNIIQEYCVLINMIHVNSIAFCVLNCKLCEFASELKKNDCFLLEEKRRKEKKSLHI